MYVYVQNKKMTCLVRRKKPEPNYEQKRSGFSGRRIERYRKISITTLLGSNIYSSFPK